MKITLQSVAKKLALPCLLLASQIASSDGLGQESLQDQGKARIKNSNSELITNLPSNFEEIKYEVSSPVSTRALGDPGPGWNIILNNLYNNTFIPGTTNHYYLFQTTASTKLTARVWNIPAIDNYDIALYFRPDAASVWSRVATSEHPSATEEQLSFVSQPGEYMFEVADIPETSTANYNFIVTTTDNFDANEHDDNFWQARIQTQYETVQGTIDNNFDKDFIQFNVNQTETVTFSIIGGDYTARLYFDNGTEAFLINSNSLARLTLPAGVYFWEISSPSESVNPATTYEFGQRKDINRITLNFASDEQAGYSRRVDWGEGTFFPFRLNATVSGTAMDEFGNPIADTRLLFEVESSINGVQSLAGIATTDSNGNYSIDISSPVGAGEFTRPGGALTYVYDVHRMNISEVNELNQIGNIPTITQIDDVSQINSFGSFINLNDVAYYY